MEGIEDKKAVRKERQTQATLLTIEIALLKIMEVDTKVILPPIFPEVTKLVHTMNSTFQPLQVELADHLQMPANKHGELQH